MGTETKNTEPKVAIKVITPFRDKNDRTIRYAKGAELEFDKERAEDVVSRELAEYVEPIG